MRELRFKLKIKRNVLVNASKEIDNKLDLIEKTVFPIDYEVKTKAKDIDDIQKLKKDLNPQKVELEKRLDEISTMNQKEMVCLINQVREYCALRIQNAERILSSNK